MEAAVPRYDCRRLVIHLLSSRHLRLTELVVRTCRHLLRNYCAWSPISAGPSYLYTFLCPSCKRWRRSREVVYRFWSSPCSVSGNTQRQHKILRNTTSSYPGRLPPLSRCNPASALSAQWGEWGGFSWFQHSEIPRVQAEWPMGVPCYNIRSTPDLHTSQIHALVLRRVTQFLPAQRQCAQNFWVWALTWWMVRHCDGIFGICSILVRSRATVEARLHHWCGTSGFRVGPRASGLGVCHPWQEVGSWWFTGPEHTLQSPEAYPDRFRLGRWGWQGKIPCPFGSTQWRPRGRAQQHGRCANFPGGWYACTSKQS